jgi:hypothetical protein
MVALPGMRRQPECPAWAEACRVKAERPIDVQSRILEESQAEVIYLRGEVEVFQKAEADLQDAILKMEERGDFAVRDLTAEKEKVLTALQRANGERVRLAYEVSVLERRLNENWASAHDGGATLNGSMTGRGRAA